MMCYFSVVLLFYLSEEGVIMSGSVELIREERKFKVEFNGKVYYLKEIHNYEEEISWCEFYNENDEPIEDSWLRKRIHELVFSAFKQ